MTIWLAIVTHNDVKSYNEYHIRYEGHTSVDNAKKEILEVRRRLINDEKLPLDCYVYEADEPMYGYTAYNLDDIDFNFYRELTPEEKARKKAVEKELEEKMNV
jgi:hypothetical protein